jgi:hypothetical protein
VVCQPSKVRFIVQLVYCLAGQRRSTLLSSLPEMLAAISSTRLRAFSTAMGMVHISLFLRQLNIASPRVAFALQSPAVPDEQSDAELLEGAEAAIERLRSRLLAIAREQYLANRELTLRHTAERAQMF